MRSRLKGTWRDRRGAGIAEYALLLLIILIIGALVFKFVGSGVKHAGNKTNEQFAGGGGAGESSQGAGAGGGSAGDKGRSGDKKSGDKSAGQNQEGTSGQGAGQSGGATAGGGGAGGGGGGAQASQNQTGGGGSADDEQPGEERKTPFWKIIGGVFVLLFAIGGYFAFRKTKSAG
jgi:Flp pilus assembly pilin Flp